MQSPGKRTALLGISVGLGMMLTYLEANLPVFMGVPGMKPGFSNILVVFILYVSGWKEALLVNFVRIMLSGLLFGNPFSIIYSLSGAAVSFIAMCVLKRSGIFSCYGVSMTGGIFHNAGQIIAAIFLVENYRIILYLPILIVTGCATGLLTGFLSAAMIKRVGRLFTN